VLPARHVRLDSPLALLAPESRVDAPVPTPLYLLEFVAGTMKRDYEQTAQGSIAHEEDSHQRRQIVYEDGARLTVHVQGSQVVGLPTQFDKDYLFGLFRLAAEGRVRPDGSFVDPSYREILRATGRPEHAGKLKFDAVKRALARFASLVITTNAELDYGATAAAVGAGTAVPATPEGRPGRRTLEAKHWVLEYEVLTETRAGGQERDLIGRLRLNPMWLEHVTAGVAAWVDVETHNGLPSEWAKRVYQVLAVRAARGWRAQTPHVVSLERFLEELGVTTSRERGKVADNLRRALTLLEQAGVVAEWEIERSGGARYEVTIYAGDRLLAAGLLRGVDPHSPVGAQVLLAHLRAYGVSVEQGREFLARRPAYVRSVLTFAHYLQTEKKGFHGTRRIENWNAWLFRALVDGTYEFEDAAFAEWLERQVAAALSNEPAPAGARAPSVASRGRPRRAPRPAGGDASPPTVGPTPAATGAPAEREIPIVRATADDPWTRAVAGIRDAVPPALYAAYLADTALDAIAPEGEVVVRAADDFAAEKVVRSWGDALLGALRLELGEAATLRVNRFRVGDPADAR
jgi:hypothetical protein